MESLAADGYQTKYTDFRVIASPELAASLNDPWKWREANVAKENGLPADKPDLASQHPTCERSPAVCCLLPVAGTYTSSVICWSIRWCAGATMLCLLTGCLPWAVTADFDLWELAHNRQPLKMWSVTSSGVSAVDPPCHGCTQ